jgi:DNA-binding NarL/FixJ family response regulator
MSLVLCDDHEMFLDALREALEASGLDVAAVTGDPTRLPALVASHRPSLVLLDVHLPGTTGVRLAESLRAEHPSLPLVLLTASREPWVRDAFDSGLVDGLIGKDNRIHVLEDAVRRVLAGEKVLVGWRALPEVRRRTALDLLTPREREVLELLAAGATTRQMAEALAVSPNTVRTHVRGVLDKLGVHQRTKAACAAIELGLAS